MSRKPPIDPIRFIVLALSIFALGISTAGDKVDMSGTWLLDPERSDDPEAKIRESMEKMRGGGGPGEGRGGMGGGPGGGMGGGPGGGMGGGPDGGGRGPMGGGDPRQAMAELIHGLERLQIDHDDPSLVVTCANGRTRELSTGGKKQTVEAMLGVQEIKTRWKGDRTIVVKMKPVGEGPSPSVTEYYEYNKGEEGGSALYVTVKVEPPRGEGFSFRQVYRLSESTDDEG